MRAPIFAQFSFASKGRLSLPKDSVHVWHMTLDLSRSRVGSLFQTLSREERDRASRFRLLRDRTHFIVRRGVLRKICSAYLEETAPKLAFEYGPRGKPHLSRTQNGMDLRFSLSHSDGIALYAITEGREVGIDIERIRFNMAWESVAPMCLSAREIALLRSLSPPAQTRTFFMLWTRKEAYVKARGTGLSAYLSDVDVLGRPYAGSLYDLNVGRHYMAALAVEADRPTVVSRRWTGAFATGGVNSFDARAGNRPRALPDQNVTLPVN